MKLLALALLLGGRAADVTSAWRTGGRCGVLQGVLDGSGLRR